MPSWIILITWLTRIVLLLLVLLSVWSVAIMLERFKIFRKEDESETNEALKLIEARDLKGLQVWAEKKSSLKSRVALSLIQNQKATTESLLRRISSQLSQERSFFEKGLNILGSLGSNAPFIGLFGTVLGVIQAFGALSFQQGNMSMVMLSIAEALIATAVGLFVAIPAVLSYNYFGKRLKRLINDCESLRDLFIAVRN